MVSKPINYNNNNKRKIGFFGEISFGFVLSVHWVHDIYTMSSAPPLGTLSSGIASMLSTMKSEEEQQQKNTYIII